jgi:hypothetical protein
LIESAGANLLHCCAPLQQRKQVAVEGTRTFLVNLQHVCYWIPEQVTHGPAQLEMWRDLIWRAREESQESVQEHLA